AWPTTRSATTPRAWSARSGPRARGGANTSGDPGRTRFLEREPDAANRLQHAVAPAVLELAAEVPDVDIHHVALRIEMHVPHLLQQLGAADHLSGMKQEVLQQLEFARCQVQPGATCKGHVFQPVELDGAEYQAFEPGGSAAPYQRAQPGEQLVELEGLG